MEPTSTWSIQRTGDNVTAICWGEIDLYNVPQLRNDIRRASAEVNFQSITLDWNHVTYVDTAGLAFLLELRALPVTGAAGLCLEVSSNSQPARVVTIGRFEQMLKVQFNPPQRQQSEDGD